MTRQWVWIATAVAKAVHAEQLGEHGGGEGVRDDGLLESAMVRPRNLARYGAPDGEDDLAALAAAYAFGIARNHPFVDGNRRTAAVVSEPFLMLNGAAVSASDAEMGMAVIALAGGDSSEAELAHWFRGHLAWRELPPPTFALSYTPPPRLPSRACPAPSAPPAIRRRSPRCPAARAAMGGRWRGTGFLGALALTGSVSAAAGAVGPSRESAYRLRRRPGAESFAAVWDAVLKRAASAKGPLRKVTVEALRDRVAGGRIRVVISGSRHVATVHGHDNSALLGLWGRIGRRRGFRTENRGCAIFQTRSLM